MPNTARQLYAAPYPAALAPKGCAKRILRGERYFAAPPASFFSSAGFSAPFSFIFAL